MEQKKLYVITRSKYTQGYKAVQSGHAVAEYLLHNDSDWNNGYLIFVESEDLDRLMVKLQYKNINYIEFKEPDLDYETTAIACYSSGREFKGLKLL